METRILKYSEFHKCDLHIHTDKSNVTKENDYKGIFSVEHLVDKLTDKENNVEMFSLTDHNIFNVEAYEEFYKKYKDADIKLFVGIELDIIVDGLLLDYIYESVNGKSHNNKKFHTLIIFKGNDVSSYNEKLNMMYSTINDKYKSKYKKSIDLNGSHIKHRITSFEHFVKTFNDEEFIIITHGDKQSDIKRAYTSYEDDDITDAQFLVIFGFISSLEMSPGKIDSIEYFNDQFNRLLINGFDSEEVVPYVVFSDNHQISAYPKYKDQQDIKQKLFTWIKGDLSFESIRLAFVDPQSRIYIGKELINLPSVFVEKLFFKTISNTGKEEEHEIEFSPCINVIVGGRSSGKSLMFNSLLHSIESENAKNFISDYIKEENKVLIPESIKLKLNINKEFKKLNNCEVEAFTQESIIKLFIDNGQGLSDNLPFKKFDEQDLSVLLNNVNNSLDMFSSCYSDLYKDRNLSKCVVLVNDLFLNNKVATRRYQYSEAIEKLNGEYDSIEKINDLLQALTNHSNDILKFRDESINSVALFSKNEKKLIDSYVSLLGNKNETIKFERQKSDIIFNFIQSLTSNLNELEDKYLTKADLAIKEAQNKIDSSLSWISNYYKEVIKIYKVISSIKKINITNQEKIVNYSPNYELHTTLESDINYDLIKSIICENVKGYDNSKSLFDNCFNLLKNETNVKWHSSSPEDFEKVIDKVKTTVREKLIPKYTIIDLSDKTPVSSDNMSQGKKASVYLDILLDSCFGTNKIVLIDQPEDNIDNEFIKERLVSKIRSLRFSNQVILVTHNAAIAINSDSENIIVSTNKDNEFDYCGGGIEDIPHRKRICKLLDGGEYIFDNRYHKYNIENSKVYKPIRKDEDVSEV